ncbi:MAG: sulfite exporter TauE/SafE family protein [Candidatus Thorarchaeota archaeon]
MTVEIPTTGSENHEHNKRPGNAFLFPLMSISLAILVIALVYFFWGQDTLISFPSSVEGLPILTFFVLGMTVGMSQCVFKSIPYLLPLVATTNGQSASDNPGFFNQNQQSMIKTSLAFSMGRLLVYLFYGLSIVVVGSVVLVTLMDSDDSHVLLTISYGLGGLIAFLYALKRFIHVYKGSCEESCLVTKKYERFEGAFALGAMSSVAPCFPMILTLWISFWGFTSSKNILVPILIPLAFSLGSLIPILSIAILLLSGQDLLSLGIGPRGIWISQMFSALITIAVAVFLLGSFWLFIL